MIGFPSISTFLLPFEVSLDCEMFGYGLGCDTPGIGVLQGFGNAEATPKLDLWTTVRMFTVTVAGMDPPSRESLPGRISVHVEPAGLEARVRARRPLPDLGELRRLFDERPTRIEPDRAGIAQPELQIREVPPGIARANQIFRETERGERLPAPPLQARGHPLAGLVPPALPDVLVRAHILGGGLVEIVPGQRVQSADRAQRLIGGHESRPVLRATEVVDQLLDDPRVPA